MATRAQFGYKGGFYNTESVFADLLYYERLDIYKALDMYHNIIDQECINDLKSTVIGKLIGIYELKGDESDSFEDHQAAYQTALNYCDKAKYDKKHSIVRRIELKRLQVTAA